MIHISINILCTFQMGLTVSPGRWVARLVIITKSWQASYIYIYIYIYILFSNADTTVNSRGRIQKWLWTRWCGLMRGIIFDWVWSKSNRKLINLRLVSCALSSLPIPLHTIPLSSFSPSVCLVLNRWNRCCKKIMHSFMKIGNISTEEVISRKKKKWLVQPSPAQLYYSCNCRLQLTRGEELYCR